MHSSILFLLPLVLPSPSLSIPSSTPNSGSPNPTTTFNPTTNSEGTRMSSSTGTPGPSLSCLSCDTDNSVGPPDESCVNGDSNATRAECPDSNNYGCMVTADFMTVPIAGVIVNITHWGRFCCSKWDSLTDESRPCMNGHKEDENIDGSWSQVTDMESCFGENCNTMDPRRGKTSTTVDPTTPDPNNGAPIPLPSLLLVLFIAIKINTFQ